MIACIVCELGIFAPIFLGIIAAIRYFKNKISKANKQESNSNKSCGCDHCS